MTCRSRSSSINREERAGAHMQGQGGPADVPAFPSAAISSGVKCRPAVGRGDRAGRLGIDGLVATFIGRDPPSAGYKGASGVSPWRRNSVFHRSAFQAAAGRIDPHDLPPPAPAPPPAVPGPVSPDGCCAAGPAAYYRTSSRSSMISTAPPLGFCACKRAGSTRVSLATRRSPGASRSGISEKLSSRQAASVSDHRPAAGWRCDPPGDAGRSVPAAGRSRSPRYPSDRSLPHRTGW